MVDEYHQINADTNTILHSFCLQNCSVEEFSIQWKILGGKQSSANNSIDWSLFEFMEEGQGYSHQNFTIKQDWFHTYPSLQYLLIKVFYYSSSSNGYGISYIKIHRSSININCSIAPLKGSTETLFHVGCNSSFAANEKRAYTLFGRISWIISFDLKLSMICLNSCIIEYLSQ